MKFLLRIIRSLTLVISLIIICNSYTLIGIHADNGGYDCAQGPPPSASITLSITPESHGCAPGEWIEYDINMEYIEDKGVVFYDFDPAISIKPDLTWLPNTEDKITISASTTTGKMSVYVGRNVKPQTFKIEIQFRYGVSISGCGNTYLRTNFDSVDLIVMNPLTAATAISPSTHTPTPDPRIHVWTDKPTYTLHETATIHFSTEISDIFDISIIDPTGKAIWGGFDEGFLEGETKTATIPCDIPGTYTARMEGSFKSELTGYTTFQVLPAGSTPPTPTIPPSTSTPPPQTQTPGPSSPTFDFTVTVSPSTMEIRAGEPAHYQILIDYSDPVWDGTPINLHFEIPEWMQWDLSPTRELTITTPHETPQGTYIFSVIGEAQGRERGVDVNLIIIEGSGESRDEVPYDEHPSEEEERRHVEEEEQRLREEEEQRHIEEELWRAEEEERRRMEENRFTFSQLTKNPLFWVTIMLAIVVAGLAIAFIRKGAPPRPDYKGESGTIK